MTTTLGGRANAEAKDGSDFYREFFMRAPDAFMILENDAFTDCNAAAVAMLCCENRDQLLRTHPSDFSPPFQPDGRPSREKADELIGIALRKGSHRFEWDHLRLDGEILPAEVTLIAVTRDDGKTVLHATVRDLSQRRHLELELRQAQKMEAVGRLTGGIAHDFNNLLASILGNCELMDMDLDPGHPARDSLAEIKSAGDRAADLVSQLLAFSRKQILRTTVFDLGDVLRRSVAMLRHLLGENMEARVSAWSHPLHVRGDFSQLQQVLLNLAANARDASNVDGEIRFETALFELTAGDIPADSPLAPGPHAMLRVTDSGEGIDPELLSKVFEPFYTTKGHGTGLGLATSHGIMRQSDGDLILDSRPGMGTMATMVLPLTDDLADHPSPAPAPARHGRGETVLLVEDESSVALLAARVLGQAGYTVVTSGNGRHALEQVEATGLEFDLLFTDVIMPVMGGPELAERLRVIRPGLKVLFSSGYTDDALTARGALLEGVDLLRKPYGVEELKRRVRKALDQD